jgi:signal transduction histidine kinase
MVAGVARRTAFALLRRMEAARLRFEDLLEEEVARAMGRLLAIRAAAFPWSFGIIGAFALLDTTIWRSAVMIPLLAASLALAFRESARFRRRGAVPGMLFLNVAAHLVTLFVVITLTGGVRSPLVPVLPVFVVMQTLLLPQPTARRVAAAPAMFVLILGAVQAFGPAALVRALEFGGEMQSAGARMTCMRTVLLFAFAANAYAIARVVRSTFESMARRALAARDEALQSYADETRTLTTLAGEIAHEIKNPLASVKALAALLGRELSGRAADSMAVMRREIDRMQGILDEFLNFSRPLVPLAQGEVDVIALCADVAALHEGVAAERRVRIRVQCGEGLLVRCDRRKVKQILVNLLQNAIAASPVGGEIGIDADAVTVDEAPAIRIAVRDQGGGLPPEIAPRIFSPGVTTKSGGSGFGLTVSRALARQHGGELTLRNGVVGCVGELLLPRYGAQPQAAA